MIRIRGLADAVYDRSKRRLKPLYQAPLIRLAALRRRHLEGVAFVGVTGSCGKTTAKDLIAAVLSRRHRGTKTSNSNNREYASARAILSLTPWSRFCVSELGASGPDSLDELIALTRPRIGVVTNVGADHLKTFRSPEAVALEKGKLVEALPADGTAVLNADDPLVLPMAARCAGDVLTYGLSTEADVRGRDVRSVWPETLALTVRHGGRDYPLRSRLHGAHLAPLLLAALSVGRALGVPLSEGIEAVEGVEPVLGRMSPQDLGDGVSFLRDDWKAPHWSLPPVIEFLGAARATRRVAVVGTISDIRGRAGDVYRSLARRLAKIADCSVFVGRWASSALKAKLGPGDGIVKGFDTVRDAAGFLEGYLRPGDLVLLEGGNPQDHLSRIPLARTRRVACWRQCRRQVFCESCALLGIPHAVGGVG